jgi:protein-S-isoprenylcysteine O-methyltransferase Ste14
VAVPRLRSSTLTIAVAWLGGVAFVGSLGYFLYFYLVLLGRPAREVAPLASALPVNVGLFGLFALHHSVMARARAKAWIARRLPAGLERSVYVWVASLLFLLVCLGWQRVPGELYRASGAGAWALRAVQAAGVFVILQASGALSFLELAGITQARDADAPAGAPAPALMTRGVYGVVRHPIYLGWLLLSFGVPVMTIDRAVFATTSAVYLLAAIRWEERTLCATFGEAYGRYARLVRWRVLPGIY